MNERYIMLMCTWLFETFALSGSSPGHTSLAFLLVQRETSLAHAFAPAPAAPAPESGAALSFPATEAKVSKF